MKLSGDIDGQKKLQLNFADIQDSGGTLTFDPPKLIGVHQHHRSLASLLPMYTLWVKDTICGEMSCVDV